jgi:hypothetical protein
VVARDTLDWSYLFARSPPLHTSTRTDSYSVCAQGRRPWQYLVRTAYQDPRATCDAAPRAESISEIYSSLSLIGLDARADDNAPQGVVQDQCTGNLPLFPEFFHGLQLSVLPLPLGGQLHSYMPTARGSSAEAFT